MPFNPLHRYKAAGVTVRAEGGQLRVQAVVPPDPALLHDLVAAKQELLALLRTKTSDKNLDAGDAAAARRKNVARDIRAGLAAGAVGEDIDPRIFDRFSSEDVSNRTAELLDAQTSINRARWEAGAAGPSVDRAKNAAAEMEDERLPLSANEPTPLDAHRQVWPEAVVLPAEPKLSLPPSEPLVQRLTAALMRPRPWMRITDPERARGYFEARARHMLATTSDPLALVEREERSAAAQANPDLVERQLQAARHG
jgi:hypothetical protein